MKCGDIVINRYVPRGNPYRYFIYIQCNGKMSSVVNYDGKRLSKGDYYTSDLKNKPDIFEVVGHIDVKEYLIRALNGYLEG